MTSEMDVAILSIKSASVAHGGCIDCAAHVLHEAMVLRPDLPWKMAATGLASEHTDEFEWAVELLDVV